MSGKSRFQIFSTRKAGFFPIPKQWESFSGFTVSVPNSKKSFLTFLSNPKHRKAFEISRNNPTFHKVVKSFLNTPKWYLFCNRLQKKITFYSFVNPIFVLLRCHHYPNKQTFFFHDTAIYLNIYFFSQKLVVHISSAKLSQRKCILDVY